VCQYWSLNSMHQTYLAGTPPLEACRQPFLLWLFWRWAFGFCSGQPAILLFQVSCHCWNDKCVTTTSSYFPLRWGSHELTCVGCPGSTILLSSASQVVRITRVIFSQEISSFKMFSLVLNVFLGL
jgi:hypothetical protein